MGRKWNLPAWAVFAVVILLGLPACSGFGMFDEDTVYFRVTSIQTDPAVVHVGEEVQLSHVHTGSYDGYSLGMVTPDTRWDVSRGYFLDDSYGYQPDQEFDPHTAQLQTVFIVVDDPRWLAPAEPGPVDITCLYYGDASDERCRSLTVTIDVLPAP